jgi:hypothetical protein
MEKRRRFALRVSIGRRLDLLHERQESLLAQEFPLIQTDPEKSRACRLFALVKICPGNYTSAIWVIQ